MNERKEKSDIEGEGGHGRKWIDGASERKVSEMWARKREELRKSRVPQNEQDGKECMSLSEKGQVKIYDVFCITLHVCT